MKRLKLIYSNRYTPEIADVMLEKWQDEEKPKILKGQLLFGEQVGIGILVLYKKRGVK